MIDAEDDDYLPFEGSDDAKRAVEAFWSSPEGRARSAEMRKRSEALLEAEKAKAIRQIEAGDYEEVDLNADDL